MYFDVPYVLTLTVLSNKMFSCYLIFVELEPVIIIFLTFNAELIILMTSISIVKNHNKIHKNVVLNNRVINNNTLKTNFKFYFCLFNNILTKARQ
jgi:hypothetical protein